MSPSPTTSWSPLSPPAGRGARGCIGVKLRKSCQLLSPGRGARMWPIAKAMGSAHFLGFNGKPRKGRQNRVRSCRNSSVAAAAAWIASPARSHGLRRGPHSSAPNGVKLRSRLFILTSMGMGDSLGFIPLHRSPCENNELKTRRGQRIRDFELVSLSGRLLDQREVLCLGQAVALDGEGIVPPR